MLGSVVMLLVTLTALLQGSLLIEPAGFSVVREGSEVKVDWVDPKGPAASLEVGAVIVQVQGPAPHEGKDLAKLDDEQLLALLTPPFFEPLRLFVKPVKGHVPRVMISRRDVPPPDYYATVPWPPERVARLTAQERMLYDAQVRVRAASAPEKAK